LPIFKEIKYSIGQAMNTSIRRVFVAPNFLRFEDHDYGFQMMQLWIS